MDNFKLTIIQIEKNNDIKMVKVLMDKEICEFIFEMDLNSKYQFIVREKSINIGSISISQEQVIQIK